MPAIMWFEANYMKLNPDKCHFLIAGRTPELLWAKVGQGGPRKNMGEQSRKITWDGIDKKS